MNNQLSAHKRAQIIDQMSQQTYDLAIIGGGINGAGVARDAASRGMRVALVEMNDFAEGTSSRSSKLIHGGIRYLENLDFHLVFEALSERQILFDIAPHLVHPLRFLIPLFRGGRVGMFKMGLGMWLYDALSLFDAPELHQRLSPQEAHQQVPSLTLQNLLGAYIYSDAYMDDDRLVLETMRSAAQLGAQCANFVRAEEPILSQGKIQALRCQHRGGEFLLKAKHIVCTVGPWTDQLGSKMFSDWQKLLRPTKGVHLTIARQRFPLSDAVVMAAESRIVFAIPRHEMVIIGTTDTEFSGDPQSVHTSVEDVDYLLRVTNKYFPGAKITVQDVLASYSGVRPLVDDGAQHESKTSREHLIFTDPRNITFMCGGKYTTYRRMAQQCVNSALSAFPVEDQLRFAHSVTDCAINSLITSETFRRELRLIEETSAQLGIPAAIWRQLVTRHGSEAYHLLGSCRPKNEQELWLTEAQYAINETMCMNLKDFVLRRTPLFLSKADHGQCFYSQLANLFAENFNWSDTHKSEQVQELEKHRLVEMTWRVKDIK